MPQGQNLQGKLAQVETFATPKVPPAKPPKKQSDKSPPVAKPVLATEPEAPVVKPIPALQRYGVTMDINQVNENVDQMAAAFLKSHGYNPTPGLVFDVLKANGQTGKINYTELFGIPTSNAQAITAGVARRYATLATEGSTGDNIATLPIRYADASQLIKGMTDAIKLDRSGKEGGVSVAGVNPAGGEDTALHAWMTANKESMEYALTQPDQRDKLIRAMMNQNVPRAAQQLVYDVQTAGVNPSIVAKGIQALARPLNQITYATTDMPYGFYKIVRGAGLDAFDLSTVPMHNLGVPVAPRADKATHTYDLMKAMGQQIVYQDIAHPIRNSGYLGMDIWAAATFGAGAVSKVGRAGTALRSGEVRLAAKTLVTKAPPQYTNMGLAGFTESLPLNDTTLVRLIQENTPVFGRIARQDRMVAEHTTGFSQEDTASLTNKLFGSSERMVARTRQRRNQIDYAIALTPVTEMVRLARADQWARDTLKEVIDTKTFNWKGVAVKHRLGAQKALQVLFTDDPEPVTMWRSLHERQIGNILADKETFLADVDNPKSMAAQRAVKEFDYAVAAHRSQLEALDLAAKIIANPTPRFKALLDRAHEVSAQQARDKEYVTGFDKEAQDQHLAEVAATARGENVIPLGGGLKGITEEAPEYVQGLFGEQKRLTDAKEAAQKRLSSAKRVNRLHPGTVAEELERHTKAVVRNEKALGRVEREIARIQDEAVPLTRQVTEDPLAFPPESTEAVAVSKLREGTPGSAYPGPMQPIRYKRGTDQAVDLPSQQSRFGFRPGTLPIRNWTGESLEMGDFRWDTTELLQEQFQLAHRAAMHKATWESLWSIATDRPSSSYDRPIRDIKGVPDELRRFVDQMERARMDQRFAAIATEAHMDSLREFLYPTEEEIRKGTVKAEHVKYVDDRFVMERMGRVPTNWWKVTDQLMNNTFGIINEPMRLLLIFATPAYALNALGSAALLTIHTGFLAPAQLARAMTAEHLYGPEATRLIDRLAGQTHASSLVTEKAWYTKGSDVMMNTWARITDTYFRRAAVIHELRRAGLLKDDWKTPEDHLAELQSEGARQAVNQAAQTGRKAMLDFNSLSWPERAIMRHLFFVYSFVRASGIWSLRFLRDHGVMADALAQAGRDRKQNIEDLIGPMPDWFMRSGYFAVHPNTIYNPIQWNMPGMLEQIATPLSAIFGHTPYARASDLLGPAAQVGIETATGTDPSGTALPHSSEFAKVPFLGGSFGDAILQQWQTTPAGQIGVKQAKAAKQQPLKPEQVRAGFTNVIQPALAHERSGLHQSVFQNDGFWNTWGLALFRSGITRKVNATAGQARYFRDLRQTDPAAFHKHELDAVHAMVQRQAQVVGEEPSDAVNTAVDMVASVSQAIEDFKTAHTGEPPPNQKTINQITLDSLVTNGYIKDGAKWTARIKKDVDQSDMKSTQTELLYAAGGMAWKTWVDKVNKIDNYAQPKFVSNLSTLATTGLGDYSALANSPREEKWAYGRKAEKIIDQSAQLSRDVADKKGYDAEAAQQKWIQYVNENDKPIKVNGVEYPSPFAYQFASLTDAERGQALASYTKRPPSQLTAQQEQLLTGTRPDPIVTKGWETVSEWLGQVQSQTPLGKHIPNGSRTYYEDFIASKSPAFKKALDFARLPLAKRMTAYDPIKNSSNADAWNWVLGVSADRYDQLSKLYLTSKGKPNTAVINRYWTEHDVPILAQQIHDRYGQSFTSELRLYTGATTARDAEPRLENFLSSLVRP